MSDKIPFDAINTFLLARYPALLFVWFPQGKLQGREFVIGSLRGEPGNSLSVNTATGKWADFSAGIGGADPISLFAEWQHGGDRVQAARHLARELHVPAQADDRPQLAADTWEEAQFGGVAAPANRLQGWDHVYEYRRADGTLRCAVLRKDKPDGGRGKIVPLSYGRLNGELGWHHRHPGIPRPLYGLDRLAARPDAPVLICEGEKAADAASAKFAAYVAVTWPAGTNNVEHADWSPLDGREVVVWPDADIPGYRAAAAIVRRFPSARTLDVLEEPQGFDAADLDAEDVNDWLGRRLAPPRHVLDVESALIAGEAPKTGPLPDRAWIAAHSESAPDDQAPEPPPPNEDSRPPDEQRDEAPAPAGMGEGIVALGHDGGVYYYLSRATRQVTALHPRNHTQRDLMGLASLPHYWENSRFVGPKGGIDWNAAADDMMRACRAVGIYNPARVLGRGAWIDNDRTVLHLGDRLIVDGRTSGLMLDGSNMVYQAAPPMLPVADYRPLTNLMAHRLVEICRSLPFRDQTADGTLLAGWIALAPVCGALDWRPSVWIVGGAGSGKTTIMERVIRACLGKVALHVAANTTESAIRRALGCDARPVIFDEAEHEDHHARVRMQDILSTVRQSASDSAAAILKADQKTGGVYTFRIRSCFAFSSIVDSVDRAADMGRIAVLELRKAPKRPDIMAYRRFREMLQSTVTPDFGGGLIMRSTMLLPTIMRSAEAFSWAITELGGTARLGDQIGTLLAGAYSLHKSQAVAIEEARRYVGDNPWILRREHTEAIDTDENRCWSALMAMVVPISTGSTNVRQASVGALLEACIRPTNSTIVVAGVAEDSLTDAGFKVVSRTKRAGWRLMVSNTHPAIARALMNTPWSVNWSRVLLRIEGSEAAKGPQRFRMHQSRAVQVPVVLGDDDEQSLRDAE